jgi:predicted DNA-binding transcriptional regulator AlpA
MQEPQAPVAPALGSAREYLSEMYLTQKEVAAHLRLSERTLERYRVSGTGPRFIRLGRRIVYRRGDIEEWASAHTVTSTSEYEVWSCR